MTEDRPVAGVGEERPETRSGESASGERDGVPEAPSEPIDVRSGDELDALVDDNDVVLADFHAGWCSPCQAVEPVVEGIAAETDAAVAKIDVDANQPLAAGHDVRAIPTLVLFADGAVVERFVGNKPPEALVGAVERRL